MFYEILDYVLPSSDRSKHDTLRLEYICACQIMENENDIMKILKLIHASFFETLLQSVIYKCYLKFINIDDISIQNFHRHLDKREIVFPETLSILILNWPHKEFVLNNQIPPLHPPVELFQNKYGPSASLKQSICLESDMINVFSIFCNRLIQFIIQAVFKCTPENTQGFSCNLKKLDLSGLESFCSLGDILDGIRNSIIETFGHKIEIFADAIIEKSAIIGLYKGINLISNIIEDNLNPDFGISVNFKGIVAELDNHDPLPMASEFYNALAPVKCEYIELWGYHGFDIDTGYVGNLATYLPELVRVNLIFDKSIKNLDFLNELKYLEQVNFCEITHHGLINSICNMSKGLKCLHLRNCSLHNKDIECLANSVHTDTLLELNIGFDNITNDSKAVGLTMLCHKLKHVKVLIVNHCSLNKLSPNSVSQLVNAFNDCIQLEFLSMRDMYPFSLDITTIFIDGLAHNKSLRYLSLDLPKSDNANIDYQHKFCKTFHETINKFRNSPIYISWQMDDC